jgi:hypothetical protein
MQDYSVRARHPEPESYCPAIPGLANVFFAARGKQTVKTSKVSCFFCGLRGLSVHFQGLKNRRIKPL